MKLLNRQTDRPTQRKLPRMFAVALIAVAALSLGGCGDTFTQVYQRGYIPPEGA
jgi:hypothetical protein